ncbi:3-oxoacyl-[acyl-carrier-protein] synthase III C-terminal domain-containing protein [Streptomyces sp. TRM76323]|uniref:3-oxoacyl-[acyl-carrier-protein] synthase III C-terminal domain-containing protein n=1 Tax=Streptomyces tamarix TaxID=3078565 RepID=A0ABU3QEL3_9ACTN|nr:3-oxoacyl-[acyl-carrier-protein] synthase III C-terminal domain-containing protein [Streptomyces tamarix]MDT9681210.1 3-oxoacyl-[acyl-carrier-protein] synthase III C-terminal domain-containing protein [Streptomyces tamarix]
MIGWRARLEAVAVHLPERWVPLGEREEQIDIASKSFTPPRGLVTQLTGVRGVHLAGPNEQPSALAVHAARKALADSGVSPDDIDLLIFASSSQDMVEPATSHMVADQLGVSCPAFDVKNACNSVLNAIEVCQALLNGASPYRRALITCGETPSRATRLAVPDPAAFTRAFPSYGFSDAGAALLFSTVRATEGAPGVLGCRFAADSSAWPCATLLYGGSASLAEPDEEHRYFRMDSARLRQSMHVLVPRVFTLLGDLGLTAGELAFVGVHQVMSRDAQDLCDAGVGVDERQLIATLPDHGNVAAASLPLQLTRALAEGRAHPGDLVALLGMAAGSSAGLVVLRL